MADSRTYLNVPFIEKDSAKALGARWDPTNKKWYVPANMDIAPFARWNTETMTSELSSTTSLPKTRNSSSSSSNGNVGGITYPADKNFIPYNGDEPPWNLT